MNRNYIFSFILSSMFLGQQAVQAQENYVSPPIEKVRKPYKFDDNLFYGYSIGASYSLSSFVKEQHVLSMLRPNLDFYLGKTFTKLLSARVSLGYHCQAASIGYAALDKIYEFSGEKDILDNGPNYSIHMANMSIDGMLCFNRLFGNKNQNAKVRLYALAGAGINACIAYPGNPNNWEGYISLNRSFKIAPELHAGLQFAFRASDKTDFTIQATWHQSTKDYTGLSIDGNSRHYVELTLGITKRLINRYASYVFEDCRGNETYYFDIIEERLLKKQKSEHGKSVVSPSENDTIISFPHTYPYLTPLQTSKLEKVVKTLRKNPSRIAVIDIYPYVTDNDEISFSQSVQLCKDEINTILTKLWGEDPETRVQYREHIFDNSPVTPDGIWFHNAFISYEEVRQ